MKKAGRKTQDKKNQNMNRRDKKIILFYFIFFYYQFWKKHKFWHLNVYRTARHRLTKLAEVLIQQVHGIVYRRFEYKEKYPQLEKSKFLCSINYNFMLMKIDFSFLPCCLTSSLFSLHTYRGKRTHLECI